MIKEHNGIFEVYIRIPGHVKKFSELCNMPADMVYAGSRDTEIEAKALERDLMALVNSQFQAG